MSNKRSKGRKMPKAKYIDLGFRWVEIKDTGQCPPDAVIGGKDVDGSLIFVGRANHEGALIPAKVLPNKSSAYVTFGGKEHRKDKFQFLCGRYFDWFPSSKGSVPENAFVGGHSADGTPLYVGRMRHRKEHLGVISVGKVQSIDGVCYIPFKGEELSFDHYEVLVNEKYNFFS